MTRGPTKRGSIAARVTRFFADNPDEELTVEDACVKFGCSIGTIRNNLPRLQRRGVLKVRKVRVLCAPAVPGSEG